MNKDDPHPIILYIIELYVCDDSRDSVSSTLTKLQTHITLLQR